jgi:sugar lactone lactonase YvrE
MKTKLTKLIYSAVAVVNLTTGAVIANAAPGDLFASINGTGENGAGFVYYYRPNGLQRIAVSGLSRPRGVAFTRLGNLFVANTTFADVTQTFQASIVKITPDGVQSTVATLDGNLFGEDVAFDRAGNLFVVAIDQSDPNLASTIYKFTPSGVQSMFGSLPFQSFGLAFDSSGNLFAACAGIPEVENSASIYKFTPDGTRSVFAGQSAFGPFNGPIGLAFDRLGNLFVSTEAATPAGNDTILKFTPDGVGSTFATDLDWPRGLAFDRSGNLFVAERGLFSPPGAISKFTPDSNRTVFASDVDDPQFLVFQRRIDSSWNAALDLTTNEKPDQPDPDSTELSNPNAKVPEWSYGYRDTLSGTSLTLFSTPLDEHSNAAIHGNDDMEGWQKPGGFWPLITANVSGLPVRPSPELKLLAPDELDVHPGNGFGSDTFAVVRWIAPYSSTFSISVTWRDIDWNGGDGFGAHVIVNGTSIYDANPGNGGNSSFTSTLSLIGGDVVDFVVDPGVFGDQNFDSTALKVTIHRSQ